MPWERDKLFGDLFQADGLIHTTRQGGKPEKNGRKDIINESTFRDADVCLTCTIKECSGERRCFLVRKKEAELELKRRKKNDETAEARTDD